MMRQKKMMRRKKRKIKTKLNAHNSLCPEITLFINIYVFNLGKRSKNSLLNDTIFLD